MMISFRTADLMTNIRYRDVEVVVTALVGESEALPPSAPFFVKFERPVCDSKEVRESTDARLRGILEAKSYIKNGDAFILSGLPSKAAAESAFFDVLKYLKHHNSVISAIIDSPVTYIKGTRTKVLVIRMKTRG